MNPSDSPDSLPNRTDALRWSGWHPEADDCDVGDAQSPVDLVAASAVPDASSTVEVRYRPVQASQIHCGHTLKVRFDDDCPCALVLDGVEYRLVEFHFHTPSEHRVEGAHHPAELHLVHRNARGGLAVLGVFIHEGDPSPALDIVLNRRPSVPGAEQELRRPFDPGALLPENRTWMRYDGSLTTPPLSEGVKWTVLVDPVRASRDQILALADEFPFTARPCQPLGDRVIRTGTM